MLIQEYIQLVKTLRDDQLIEFTKLFFLCKYKGTDTKIEESNWTNSYVLSIQRDDKTFNRFIYISSTNEDLSLFIKNNIKEIADYSKNNLVFRKLECFCLSFYDSNSNLVETADIDHNIALVIYDIDAIGNAIESHTDLKSFLLNTSATVSTKHAQFNRKDKILYELFTTGNKIADIKNSFIGSFIQYYLFEKGPLSSDELIALLLDHLPNLSKQTYKEAIRRSKKSGIVEFNNGKYTLTADKRMLIEEMRLVSAATENSLLQQFDMCFSEYGLKDYSHTILNLIIGLYRQQSDNELATLSHVDGSASEKELIRNLYKTLRNNGIQNDQINNVVSRIMDIISSSEYLNKMSATTLFTGLFNSNSLEDYLGKQKRIVFFDTQILLQLLCVDYSKNVDYINDGAYQDSLYEAGKILYEQIEESRDYVSLYTTPEYIREVSNHLYEAHNLNRFIHLSYIKDLGPSKNIFGSSVKCVYACREVSRVLKSRIRHI